MARSFHIHGLHPPRVRSGRSARQAALLLILLLLAVVAALWMVGSPAEALLLPIDPPA
jgi:hypothetical protein